MPGDHDAEDAHGVGIHLVAEAKRLLWQRDADICWEGGYQQEQAGEQDDGHVRYEAILDGHQVHVLRDLVEESLMPLQQFDD